MRKVLTDREKVCLVVIENEMVCAFDTAQLRFV